MIYISIDTASELRDYFVRCDRDYYSDEAYEAMIEMFEESGNDFELDVIALCCDFNELTFEEFINDYSLDIDEEIKEEIINYLEYNTGYFKIFEDRVFFQVF